MSDLSRLEAAAAQLESLPEIEETADYVGRLDKVIRTLQGHRRLIMSEVSGPTAGRDYRIVESNYAERSYNTAALLHAFDGRGVDLRTLIREDAARLVWQWTNLQRAARHADVTLVVAHHEVEDSGEVDGEMVGETWKRRLSVEGVQG